MTKCDPRAYARCPDRQHCGPSAEECVYTESSECERFNQRVLSRPMAEGDRIRSMADNELAEFLCGITDCFDGKCPAAEYCRAGHNGMREYLKQRAKEE